MPGYMSVLREQEKLERAQKEREALEGMYFDLESKHGEIWIYFRNKQGDMVSCTILGIFLPNWFFPETRIKMAKKDLINKYLNQVLDNSKTDLCKRMSGPAVELIKHPYKGNEEDE